MSQNIYKTAAQNTVKALPKRFLGWILGVYTAELIKLKAVEESKKETLTREVRRKLR
jgi:hypothetical protein